MTYGRFSSPLSVLLVLAGFAGVLIEGEQTESPSATIPAEGAFWKVLSGDGRVKRIEPESVGIVILPGDSLRLGDTYRSATTLESLTLRVQDTGEQSGFLRVHFRNERAGMYRLVVVPGESFLATLSYVAEGQPPEELASERRSGILTDLEDPYDVALHFEGSQIVVEIDGRELLRATDERLPNAKPVVWADHVRLLRAEISGSLPQSNGEPKPFRAGEDLRAMQGRSAALAARVLPTTLWALAVLLAAAGYLRSLCLGAPPASLLARSTFILLAPVGALLAPRPWLAVPYEPLLILMAATLGLRIALHALRDHLHTIAPAGVLGGARILIVVAVLGGLATWVHAHARSVALRPAVTAVERARLEVTSKPFDRSAPLSLDASNALTVPGPYRSFELDTEVTLAPDSLLELRLRAKPWVAHGIALFLSTDARWKSGFFLEGKGTFRPLGDDFGVLQAGRAQELSVRVVGDDFEASLDGQRVASTRQREFPSGSLVALAARGQARISKMTLRAIAPEPPVRDASGEAWAAGAVPWLLLVLLTLAAVALLKIPLSRALEATAWMLLPIVLGVRAWAEPQGGLPLGHFVATLVAFTGFALPWTLLHSKRSGVPRTAVFLLAAAGMSVVALNEGTGAPLLDKHRTNVTWDEFDLPRIEPGLSYLQHPYIRRFNSYLVEHTFRGRRFTTDPAPGVVRVMSLGGSSTWGHGIEESTGLDYPTVLEGLLAERLPGRQVEVINGAVRGSTIARLLRIFRESLLTFRPQIVTLSAYYNDSHHLTQIDEEAVLRRISRPDYEHTAIDRVREVLRRNRSRSVINHLWKSMGENDTDSLASWREVVTDPEVSSPPERFEAGIRAFAELGREQGFHLVLIKEPIRGNPQRIWRDEFRAVMDRLGEEYDLLVVDPEQALAAAGGRSLFMDEIHPLPEGCRVMAEVLAPLIEGLIRERYAEH